LADVAAGDVECEAALLQRLEAVADLAQLAGVLDDAPRLEPAHGDRRQGLNAHGPVDVALSDVDDVACRVMARAEMGHVDDIPQAAFLVQEAEYRRDDLAAMVRRMHQDVPV